MKQIWDWGCIRSLFLDPLFPVPVTHLHTELEIWNRQLDFVSGVPKATSRFIDSLGRLNRTQLWVTAKASKAQPAMERMHETDEEARVSLPSQESSPSAVTLDVRNSPSNTL